MSDTKLAPQIIELSDFDESSNIMIYGPSGSGKTVTAGSANNVLFLAVEKGTVSAKRIARINKRFAGKNVKIWPVTHWADLEDAYSWIMDNPDHGFDWIVIDSITQMQQIAIQDILKKENKKNASRDLDIPAIQDHQKWQNIFKRFIGYFVELPVNCCFIALVRTAVDQDKEEFLTPDIQGKNYQLSQYVCGQMSAYGYMSNRKVAMRDDDGKFVLDTAGKKVPTIIRRITWMDTGVIRGKDRYQVLEPFTEDITLNEITQLIDGEKSREELGQWTRKLAKTEDEDGKEGEATTEKTVEATPSQTKAEAKAELAKANREAKKRDDELAKEAAELAAEEKPEVEAAKESEEKEADNKTDTSKESEKDDEFNLEDVDDFDFAD